MCHRVAQYVEEVDVRPDRWEALTAGVQTVPTIFVDDEQFHGVLCPDRIASAVAETTGEQPLSALRGTGGVRVGTRY